MATNINDIIIENTLSANTLTATTIFLGNSDIMTTFAQNINGGYLPVSGGTVTGNTNFSATLSATTLFSGSTNLYSIFAQLGNEVTSVQPGTNITTGGTATVPIINLAASPSINNLILS